MTNAEKYTTVEECANEFLRFCENNKCQRCKLQSVRSKVWCVFAWLNLEDEEEVVKE